MKSPFEDATKIALEEIIMEHAEKSKFGYFMTRESIVDLTEELFKLFKTSRSLKAAGDRLIHGGTQVVGTGRSQN